MTIQHGLSRTQRAWLRRVVDAGRYDGGPGPTLHSLRKRGLVECEQVGPLRLEWTATDAGRSHPVVTRQEARE